MVTMLLASVWHGLALSTQPHALVANRVRLLRQELRTGFLDVGKPGWSFKLLQAKRQIINYLSWLFDPTYGVRLMSAPL